jgi:hypothetical protein
MRIRTRQVFGFSRIIWGLALALFLTATGTAQPSSAPTPPLTVEVGMYFLDIAKLDMKESRFFADFYIWYKAPLAASGQWSPETIAFINGDVEFASPLTADDSLEDQLYWSQRIKGRFRGNFLLQRYPLDQQSLPIMLEDREFASDRLILKPAATIADARNRWIDPHLFIPDWYVEQVSAGVLLHQYVSSFGLTGGEDKKGGIPYSRFAFHLTIHRIFLPHLVKFVIPLLIIAGMAYVVFWINAKEFESQCAISITALLTAVALHSSLADSLPSVGYLVLADKVFILFYVLIFSSLVQTVVANNLAKRGNVPAAAMLDQASQVLFPLALIAGAGGILIFS